MKKNKGFTLIELLAVIVVLAIIALIATPIVMNTIKNSKKGATEQSGENYIKQVETSLMEYRMNNNGEIFPDGTYSIDSNGNILELDINMNGTKPNGGSIVIENGQVSTTGTIMNFGDYTVSYDTTKKSYVANEGTDETPEKDNNTNENTLCKKDSGVNLSNLTYGNKFTCDVSDTESNIFYIIEITDTTVSLIMDRNLTDETVSWGSDDEEEPTQALEFLSKNTASWNKLDANKISLPTAKQLSMASGKADWEGTWVEQELASWLDDNSASYWLNDSAGVGYAWFFSGGSRNFFQEHSGSNSSIGVRPVITISKTDLG